MVPGYIYRVWGVLCGIRTLDLGPGQKTISWVVGEMALKHLNIGNPFVLPEPNNDNETKAA